MENSLDLNYSSGKILQGFRENSEFINLNYDTLIMISDKYWQKSICMNSLEQISSPTKSILLKYFINILSTILKESGNNVFNSIRVFKPKDVILDNVSTSIFECLKHSTDIKIFYENIEKSRNTTISVNNMRENIKRGLYDCFIADNTILNDIYMYYSSIFYEKYSYSITDLIKLEQKCSSNYEKWLVYKAVITMAIKTGENDMATFYLKKLKKNNRGMYDYVNSYSYLLMTENKDAAIRFIQNNIDINYFLSKKNIDYSESLVLKNYATLLDVHDSLKRKILEKCLSQTPNDVDLWKYYFNLYENDEKRNTVFTKIYMAGYTDIDIVKYVDLNIDNQEAIVRTILLCAINDNKEFANQLTSYVEDTQLQNSLKLLLSYNQFDEMIQNITKGYI